jgi:hypothetical protein
VEQLPPPKEPTDLPPDLKPKRENSLFAPAFPHWGHLADFLLSLARCSFSNRLPQLPHLYSYIGILT